MKTRLTFLTIIPLALPLVLAAPCGALAQTNDEAKSPWPAGSGRQAIIAKLERMRLDNVSLRRSAAG